MIPKNLVVYDPDRLSYDRINLCEYLSELFDLANEESLKNAEEKGVIEKDGGIR